MKAFIIVVLALTILMNLPSRLIAMHKGNYPRFVVKSFGADAIGFFLEICFIIWGLFAIGWL